MQETVASYREKTDDCRFAISAVASLSGMAIGEWSSASPGLLGIVMPTRPKLVEAGNEY
jgi:hypothetical protein